MIFRGASQPVDFDRIREIAVETGATTILAPPPAPMVRP